MKLRRAGILAVLIMILIGSPLIGPAGAQAPLPPAPALGPRPTAPAAPNVPSSSSSTGNATDLTGVWVMESKGKCWLEASPSKSSICDTLVGKLTLEEAQGRITGHFYGPGSSWKRPDRDNPQINSDGTIRFDSADFDGTTLRLNMSDRLLGNPGTENFHSFTLNFDRDNPNVLKGIQRRWGHTSSLKRENAHNSEVRFNRDGGPVVQVRTPPFSGSPRPGGSPPSGGSWVPWVLIPGVGWVIYAIARRGRTKRDKEPKEYELDIRTQDDRTTLNTDGEDLLWIYAQVRCNKPEVNTQVLTSGVTFTTEGADARWLRLGPPQQTNGFKTVPVRAWPPSEHAQLDEGQATVMVSTIIEGSKVSGPVPLALEQYELEIF